MDPSSFRSSTPSSGIHLGETAFILLPQLSGVTVLESPENSPSKPETPLQPCWGHVLSWEGDLAAVSHTQGLGTSQQGSSAVQPVPSEAWALGRGQAGKRRSWSSAG